MNESEFHRAADAWFEMAQDALEKADLEGDIDAEYGGGALTVTLDSGRQLVVSKHAPTKQLWLSSPVSGGLHFSHDGGQWKLADGRTLSELLAWDLQSLSGIEVVFP